MNIIAVIPARGGSKGIPRKNIYDLCGKPMLAYSIEQAKAVPAIGRTVVSSDDEEILSVAKAHGAETILRPADIAGDSAKMDAALVHALDTVAKEGYVPDLVVLLQPTSPLRSSETISRAINEFVAHMDSFDSLMPLAETSPKTGTIEDNQFIPGYPPGVQRQELKKQYFDCGTIHIFKPEVLRSGAFFGERIYAFPIPWPETIDIDTMQDMQLVEMLLKAKNHI